jgi:lysophospholipase L1-like esterase
LEIPADCVPSLESSQPRFACLQAIAAEWLVRVAAIVLLCAAPSTAVCADARWVATWGCAPQLVEARNLAPAFGLNGNTLRQVVRVSIGGKRLKARFSNAFGDGPLTMDSVRLALSLNGSAIEPMTGAALTFQGLSSATIPAGEEIWSDPMDFDLAPLTNVAVTIHFGQVPSALTGHPGSRTTSYLQAGDAAAAAAMPDAVETQHWYVLTGIDTAADDSSAAIVILGDSITDGRGSTTDRNNRWTDDLARRLHANPATAREAIVNEGIGGNAVLAGGLGPTAMARFDRDALRQSGAKWLIIFEGVNDIGASRGTNVAAGLIAAYGSCIDNACAKGLRVYGATITPFGRSIYFSPAHETARQAVNTWIRTSGRFDAVIDFDSATRDPTNAVNLCLAYDSGDHLHLNPAGYEAMAGAVNLALFSR